ncbi:DUF3526 domain-containing protein [Pseudorhodoferax sp. Leaf267]|uniref:DUF3526 domain-containing protein n=1 Tax=Pseudorhodoferax sp. Leaf267 TaxID=1736316 RepID=UPI0006F5496F|nr:DUF3526 domain-containing protein [Pseudorhodoferax sp. Leaf267]KQP22929.1 ABC transporter permease [Pseudorhodoferax sp. Leaf267]
MSWIAHEWRLMLRSRLSACALLLLLALASLALAAGLHETGRQRADIARLAPLQAEDMAAVERKIARSGDAGYAAYYSFHATADPPASAAFIALGLRDVAPHVLRVRALGLQAQLYEGEAFNPELALPGPFDFAFVLVYLAPLFVIALLHDLVSSERESGRLPMLRAMPGAAGRLWWRRAALRVASAFACLALPLGLAAVVAGLPLPSFAATLAIVALYLAFWAGLSLVVGTRGWTSTANATALMGCWALLTLVLPALASIALARALPVHQGVELMLAQRQEIHGAWDEPREATMQQFFRSHPQWQGTAPLPAGFHWKWYYAFQQLGDEHVADRVQAYRTGLQARQRWTERLGWLLPAVAAQAALHRLAATDLPAQLAYQDRIAAFHAELRHFYYPYVFDERRFGPADFARQPRFVEQPSAAAIAWRQLAALALVATLLALAGLRALRRPLHV